MPPMIGRSFFACRRYNGLTIEVGGPESDLDLCEVTHVTLRAAAARGWNGAPREPPTHRRNRIPREPEQLETEDLPVDTDAEPDGNLEFAAFADPRPAILDAVEHLLPVGQERPFLSRRRRCPDAPVPAPTAPPPPRRSARRSRARSRATATASSMRRFRRRSTSLESGFAWRSSVSALFLRELRGFLRRAASRTIFFLDGFLAAVFFGAGFSRFTTLGLGAGFFLGFATFLGGGGFARSTTFFFGFSGGTGSVSAGGFSSLGFGAFFTRSLGGASTSRGASAAGFGGSGTAGANAREPPSPPARGRGPRDPPCTRGGGASRRAVLGGTSSSIASRTR